MTQPLVPLTFPLHGSRLIEASAGTGKTWTIAALYVRLVLGHGGARAFHQPLAPSKILVMTFTRAATRELSDRIRARLIEAADCLRNLQAPADPFLQALRQAYSEDADRAAAAHRLALAAGAMDDAAIFTIDSWCQRMLREHAFDSGNLFDESLSADDVELFNDAARDYWRQQVYPLNGAAFEALSGLFDSLDKLSGPVRRLLTADVGRVPPSHPLAVEIDRALASRAALKRGWPARIDALEGWLMPLLRKGAGIFNGSKLRKDWAETSFAALRAWVENPAAEVTDAVTKAVERFSPQQIEGACNEGVPVPTHPDLLPLQALHASCLGQPLLKQIILEHASAGVRERLRLLKLQAQTFGFADMLDRLDAALGGQHAARLRARIVAQYPVALVDEFQDTAPVQYRIFDRLYRIAENCPQTGVFLIGDPKQSIYAFRGADIHSYLSARQATSGRHYVLDTNFRSTHEFVAAVNYVFGHAEGLNASPGLPRGAFGFRSPQHNPLPFVPVNANGRNERFVTGGEPPAALTVWYAQTSLSADEYVDRFAQTCAERIVTLLEDPCAGFEADGVLRRLRPDDIAILVQTGKQAGAVRDALQRRNVASVYLSEQDSVFESQAASDVLLWLKAVANPLDSRTAHAAWAAPTFGEPLAMLAKFANDDGAWDQRVEVLRGLNAIWKHQGVLAMLRATLHRLGLPARLLASGAAAANGERAMTDLLHIGDLLQAASQTLDCEHALIRWLADEIEYAGEADQPGDEQKVRLESDADLIKVVTIHKSKGLEYPLVFAPFVSSCRVTTRKGKTFVAYADDAGARALDFRMSDVSLERADTQRLQEDLRLLYVALTRARHAAWIGAASGSASQAPLLPKSALGYLLNEGKPVADGALGAALAHAFGHPRIALTSVTAQPACTMLTRSVSRAAMAGPRRFDVAIDREWRVSSFSALKRRLEEPAAPVDGAQQSLARKVIDELGQPGVPAALSGDDAGPSAWHAFPASTEIGTFIHAQLEWLAEQGFDFAHTDTFARAIAERCKRRGLDAHAAGLTVWLRAIVDRPIALPGAATPFALRELARRADHRTRHFCEMEFWLDAHDRPLRSLDEICAQWLPSIHPRPRLPDKALRGMLHGFIDLVFVHEDRYWVIDYKSNRIGKRDSDYTPASLERLVMEHRYDLQGLLYLLALDRLLRTRLGAAYQPERHLGGTVLFFLRGVGESSTCCLPMVADLKQLASLNEALNRAEAPA